MLLKHMLPAIIVSLSSVTMVNAQETENQINPYLEKGKSLQLYIGAATEDMDDYVNNYDFGHFVFSPAFQWTNHRYNFQEIGLDGFLATKKHGWMAFHYTYILNFFKHKESRWIPAIGFGAMPFVGWNQFIPTLSNEFPEKQLVIGARFFVAPRLTYYLSNRFSLNLEIPVNIAQAELVFTDNANPNLTQGEQSGNMFNFNSTLNGSAIKVGLGWRL